MRCYRYEQSIDKAIQTVQSEAGKLAHILDVHGLVSLLAHVLHQQAVTLDHCNDSIIEEEGCSLFENNDTPKLSEDQIYAVILHGVSKIEEVVLGTDESLTGSSNVEVPPTSVGNAETPCQPRLI